MDMERLPSPNAQQAGPKLALCMEMLLNINREYEEINSL